MEKQDIEQTALLESKTSKSQEPSFKLLFQFSYRADLLILSIGLLAMTVIAISPAVQIIQTGEILDIIEEDYQDIDTFYESERSLAFTNYVLGGITVVAGIIGVVSFVKFRTRQGLHWKQAYFRAMANQPIKWFDKRNPVELGNAVDTDCTAIEMGLGDKLMVVFSAIIFFLFSWGLCLYYSLEITLVLLLKLPISFGSHFAAMKTSEKILKEKQELYQRAGGIAEESLEGIKTVASCNAQHIIAKRYQSELEPLKTSGILMGIINGISWGVYFFQFLFFVGLGFYIGVLLIDQDVETWKGSDLGVKEVFVSCFLSAMASLVLSLAIPSLGYLYSSRIAAATVNKTIQKNKKYDGSFKPQSIRGGISLENVSFNYPTRPEINVLQGVSLEVEAGESLAIVGETGSGKSTIIQLIEGFYYCSSGSVKIDGMNIKEYDLISLRKFISLVSQEPILFNCSIAENIRIGKEDASLEEIMIVSAEAEANSFIENLPESYDTWVGVKGALLSGGQKQRIALARAMIKKPKILLLDEAISALDVNTERAIQSTIDKIMINTTTVIVAQRLSTVKRARQIVVLDKGSVVESGDYEYLIGKDGYFKRLLGVQKEAKRKAALTTIDAEAHGLQLQRSDRSRKVLEETATDKMIIKRVFIMLKDYWPLMIIVMLSAMVAGSCIPVFSYFVGMNNYVLVNPTETDKVDEIQTNFFYFTIASIAVFIGILVMCITLSRIIQLITYELRYKSLNSFLYYDQEFYDRPGSAPSLLSSGLSTDCDQVSNLGGPLLGLSLLVIASMIGGFALGLAHDVVLALFIIAFFPALLLLSGKAERIASRGFVNRNLEQTSIITSDTFSNIKTVQAFNRQEYFYNRYIASTMIENINVMKLSYWNGLVFSLRMLMLFTIWGSAAWYGAYRVKEGDISMKNMVITFFSVIMTNQAFFIVAFLSPDIEGGIRGGRNLFKIIDYIPKINANSDEGSFSLIKGAIEFKDVKFQYEGRDRIVLDSLSFKLNAGDKLGITGTTGSGKSTVGQLLLRFYDPTEGEIYLDSVPLKEYNIRHLRDSICWVGQEPILFRGSILYNLQIANPDITIDEAIDVLTKAQASDIVEKYGLDSDVGLRGNRLSGGQKQRIAIARALARKPKVLVFDESTSALDPVTEANLLESIRYENLTIISIAHRLKSIKDFDQIILIERGSVVESGNHDELMAIENGNYRELFQKSQ